MQKEIVSVGVHQFELSYDGYLSPTDKENIINKIKIESVEKIESLAPTCQASTKVVGESIEMSSSPSGGTPPYTYEFWKISPGKVTRTRLQTGNLNSLSYPTTSADIGSNTFGVTVTDSCPVGAKISEEYCFVDVIAQCPLLVCNLKLL